jgi:hypothetical protein
MGNDFIAPKVREVFVEKQEQFVNQHDEEEVAWLKALASITSIPKVSNGPLFVGTLAETTKENLDGGIYLIMSKGKKR